MVNAAWSKTPLRDFEAAAGPENDVVLGHAHILDLQRHINTTIPVNFMDKRGKACGIQRTYKNKRVIGSVLPAA